MNVSENTVAEMPFYPNPAAFAPHCFAEANYRYSLSGMSEK
jgi:hypothetical protein